MTEYKDIDFLDIKKNIKLTKDTVTGKTYVKKYLKSQSQYEIYKQLQHNNFSGIPKIIDLYFEDNCYVLIEEYIEGKSLQQLIDEKAMIFTPDRVEEIVNFLCRTLKPIHKSGIIHRDITASNIMYSYDNQMYLIDFGNSRTHKNNQSTDTEYIGTQNYAAPEQFGFGQSDRRTDIYAVGVLCNVLLTSGKYPHEQLYKGRLTKVIRRCIAVKPKDRYRSMTALKIGMFRSRHRFFTSVPMIIVYVYALLFFMFPSVIVMFAMRDEQKTDPYDAYKAIATSSPEEKSNRRWDIIENCIADGNYDEAQKRLDEAAAEGLSDIKLYRLYSQNYEAQQMYDEAAQTVIDYIYNVKGIEKFSKKAYMVFRLNYLYPNCSGSVQQTIDALNQALN